MAVTEYTWNPLTDSVIEETDGAGNVLAAYTNEPAPYGPLISEHRNGQSRQYHFDALGSTRALTDDSGTVTDTFTYDAWGNEVVHDGDSETTFRWVGWLGYSSEMTGRRAVYVRARIITPPTGRWKSSDPLFEGVLSGIYFYVTSQPTLKVDPSGWAEVRYNATDDELQCRRKCSEKLYRGEINEIKACVRGCTGKVHLGIGADPLLLGYGYYCGASRRAPCPKGPGYPPDYPEDKQPVDGLDRACGWHDCCLNTVPVFLDPCQQITCNYSFCMSAIEQLTGGCNTSPTPDECRIYAYLIIRHSPFCQGGVPFVAYM